MANPSIIASRLLQSNAAKSFYSHMRNSIVTQSSQSNIVFDKDLRIKHLDRSALSKDAHIYDYLRDHIAKDICDRTDDLKFDGKRLVLNLGSCSGLISKNLNPAKVDAFIQSDISPHSLRRGKRLDAMLAPKFTEDYINCDEERLPVRSNSVDLAMSCLDLHWVNDLVACFRQTHEALRNDCAFIGAIFGGDTLFELRSSLQLAELERLSGFSSHVAPKTTGQDVARLLQSTGYKLITVDISEIKICYPSMFELMFDLQAMGESNSSIFGSKHMHRDVLKSAAAIYQCLYGSADPDVRVPATFQIIHFIGWKNPKKATPIKSE